MKTIARQIDVKTFPFIIQNSKGNEIYYEDESGYWQKWFYDLEEKIVKIEKSDGWWQTFEYKDNGKILRIDESTGWWSESTFDESGNRIRFENSDGYLEINGEEQEVKPQ